MKRTISALALAAVMVVGVAGNAFAAQTATVTETLTVNSTVTLTLSTASIAYGNLNPGVASGSFPVTATFGTPNGNTIVTINGSPFTSGANTIPAASRNVSPATGAWDATFPKANGSNQEWQQTLPSTTLSMVYNFIIAVPAGQPSGAYSGSTTFTVTGG